MSGEEVAMKNRDVQQTRGSAEVRDRTGRCEPSLNRGGGSWRQGENVICSLSLD